MDVQLESFNYAGTVINEAKFIETIKSIFGKVKTVISEAFDALIKRVQDIISKISTKVFKKSSKAGKFNGDKPDQNDINRYRRRAESNLETFPDNIRRYVDAKVLHGLIMDNLRRSMNFDLPKIPKVRLDLLSDTDKLGKYLKNAVYMLSDKNLIKSIMPTMNLASEWDYDDQLKNKLISQSNAIVTACKNMNEFKSHNNKELTVDMISNREEFDTWRRAEEDSLTGAPFIIAICKSDFINKSVEELLMATINGSEFSINNFPVLNTMNEISQSLMSMKKAFITRVTDAEKMASEAAKNSGVQGTLCSGNKNAILRAAIELASTVLHNIGSYSLMVASNASSMTYEIYTWYVQNYHEILKTGCKLYISEHRDECINNEIAWLKEQDKSAKNEALSFVDLIK